MRQKALYFTLVLFAALLLSGCVGGPVRGTTWPGLSADANAAYLADGPYVYAVNLKDGRELWRYPAESDNDFVFFSTPAITPDGLVIVGSSGSNRSLIALNPGDINTTNNIKSPAVAWTFEDAGDQWIAPPLVVNDQLFAVNADGHLYVLDLTDGQSNKSAVRTIDVAGRLWAQPTTDGERVYLTSLDHSVIAVDIGTYEVLWHEDIEGAVAGSAVLGTDGMLYVGSLASRLVRFDPATGNHETVLDAEDWIWSTPSPNDDTLYFGDLKGNVYSFNTATSNLNWNPVQPDAAITASPLVQDEHILVATESGSLFALDRNGTVLWSENVGGKIYTTPVAAADLTLVAPLEAEFYLAALDSDGRQVWTFTPAN